MAQAAGKDYLAKFKEFDLADATAALWVFRKYAVGEQVRYTAKWVDINSDVVSALSDVAAMYQGLLAETTEYAALAEVGESQALHIAADQTHISLLIDLVNQPKQENQVQTEEELQNITGYVFHLQAGNDDLYCIKKASSSWKAKKALSFVNVVFREKEMELLEDPAFRLDKSFDMFLHGPDLIVSDKRAFESLLNYKQDFAKSFQELIVAPEFSKLFATTDELVEFVGTNAIQLRRMTVIREKGFYKDPAFMARLRAENRKKKWGIAFNRAGEIVPSADTMRTIMSVLLDHRLTSLLSQTTYDVPSTIAVV